MVILQNTKKYKINNYNIHRLIIHLLHAYYCRPTAIYFLKVLYYVTNI